MRRMRGWVSTTDRKPVSIDAKVLLHGCAVPATITDTSKSGCNVVCLQALPIGEVVQLELPAFKPQAATVRWSLGGKAGLRFV